jgi:hypothetical protein
MKLKFECLLDSLGVVAIRWYSAELLAAWRPDGFLPAAGYGDPGGATVAGHQALTRARVAGALMAPRHALVILDTGKEQTS